jgi:hypothetical protein
VNGSEPKIEIFKPFGEAFELTKKILFQPFNFEKWLVIGFAAFLTHLNGGGFNAFRLPTNSDWAKQTFSQPDSVRSFIDQIAPVWWILIGVAVFLFIAIFVVLTWIRSRGHFIFIDCIVRNRAAIVQPWKEYRIEGNSYFVFSLLWLLAIIGLVIVVALMIIVPAVVISRHEYSALAFLPLLLLLIILPIFLLLITLVQFVAPVMYRRRCKAWPAFNDLLSLLAKHLGVFVLYLLFGLVVGVAVAIAIVTATCLTCCMAAIPYVGTVIFLPVYVFLQSFSLLFIRQFGPDYDVWAAIPEPTATTGTEPPPLPS